MYGSCYTFNSNFSGAASKMWMSSQTGPLMGLQIVLNLQQTSYMSNGLTKSAGARYTIHIHIMYTSFNDRTCLLLHFLIGLLCMITLFIHWLRISDTILNLQDQPTLPYKRWDLYSAVPCVIIACTQHTWRRGPRHIFRRPGRLLWIWRLIDNINLYNVQVRFSRQKYPYDTECYADWHNTNYGHPILISRPYTFAVYLSIFL